MPRHSKVESSFKSRPSQTSGGLGMTLTSVFSLWVFSSPWFSRFFSWIACSFLSPKFLQHWSCLQAFEIHLGTVSIRQGLRRSILQRWSTGTVLVYFTTSTEADKNVNILLTISKYVNLPIRMVITYWKKFKPSCLILTSLWLKVRTLKHVETRIYACLFIAT